MEFRAKQTIITTKIVRGTTMPPGQIGTVIHGNDDGRIPRVIFPDYGGQIFYVLSDEMVPYEEDIKPLEEIDWV